MLLACGLQCTFSTTFRLFLHSPLARGLQNKNLKVGEWATVTEGYYLSVLSRDTLRSSLALEQVSFQCVPLAFGLPGARGKAEGSLG